MEFHDCAKQEEHTVCLDQAHKALWAIRYWTIMELSTRVVHMFPSVHALNINELTVRENIELEIAGKWPLLTFGGVFLHQT